MHQRVCFALSPSLLVVGKSLLLFYFPTATIASGTKFQSLLGSLCAKVHPENWQEIMDTNKILFNKKKNKDINVSDNQEYMV